MAKKRARRRDTGSPTNPLRGMVAVLDALGAKGFSRDEADAFLNARSEILGSILNDKIYSLRLVRDDLGVFVFNDTIVLTYARAGVLEDPEVGGFCALLRALEVFFLEKRILLRGAFSHGELYRVEDASNTVMGPALSDAADWFEKADWIGIHATPRTTIWANGELQQAISDLNAFLTEYRVPLKDGSEKLLRSINWPKYLYLRCDRDPVQARARLLTLLGSVRWMPPSAEPKHLHTIRFFDECAKDFQKTDAGNLSVLAS